MGEEDDKPDLIKSAGEVKSAAEILREAIMDSERARTEPTPIPDDPFDTTTEESYAECLTPRETLSRLGLSAKNSIIQLKRELEHGRIEAVAQEAIWGGPNRKRTKLALVPAWVWMSHDLTPQDDFWETGYLYSRFPGGGYSLDESRWISFFAIRFWPGGLPDEQATISPAEPVKPPAAHPTNAPSTAPSKGGRPAKPWWDELWAEMGAQLYTGGLKPSRLADIEKAMHNWVAARGDTVGETPIRKAAKLLWDAINRED